ncbi:fused signal recognition particle receptor [Natronorubrum sediminis]|uniref:Signal recognition particle receptor FtsY n=1 Tax=Natronorubrum sediminis TaxID=640943 RepID=A0A1H6G1Y0_9EURY|nr:signal recognition particle-docking protein FtsY [Natronorubrum sediminis]SEH17096.1 fused signal recognition particle receptor [Natronorubrum sediminis]
MFDNLKEKLGSFRKDAEAAAEENVEEVDDEEELEDEDSEVAEETTAPEPSDAPAATAESTGDAPSAREDDHEPADAPETRETATASDETAVATSESALENESQGEDASTETVDDTPAVASETPAADTVDEASEPTHEESDVDEETPESEAIEDDDIEVGETEDAAGASVADGTEDDDTADADEDNGTGFGAKARSLVKGKFVIEEDDLEGPLQELELALLSSDVEMNVAQEILDNIREELIGETRTFTTSTGAVVEEALHDAIYDVISVGQFDFEERLAAEDAPVTIIFTGVNGVGKTTSIAKLSQYLEERGYSSVMANGDTYRAGANEQIQEHADALDTKLISHEQGGDPAAVLYDAVEYAEANDIDVVLGDTAGRLHTDEGLMDQLEKIGRVVDPDMTLFVDEAVAGQDAVNRAREFDEAAEIDGAILTKADADSNGGAAISIAHVTGKPILFLGVGQGYDDIERFDPDEMIDRLLEDDV